MVIAHSGSYIRFYCSPNAVEGLIYGDVSKSYSFDWAQLCDKGDWLATPLSCSCGGWSPPNPTSLPPRVSWAKGWLPDVSNLSLKHLDHQMTTLVMLTDEGHYPGPHGNTFYCDWRPQLVFKNVLKCLKGTFTVIILQFGRIIICTPWEHNLAAFLFHLPHITLTASNFNFSIILS